MRNLQKSLTGTLEIMLVHFGQALSFQLTWWMATSVRSQAWWITQISCQPRQMAITREWIIRQTQRPNSWQSAEHVTWQWCYVVVIQCSVRRKRNNFHWIWNINAFEDKLAEFIRRNDLIQLQNELLTKFRVQLIRERLVRPNMWFHCYQFEDCVTRWHLWTFCGRLSITNYATSPCWNGKFKSVNAKLLAKNKGCLGIDTSIPQ